VDALLNIAQVKDFGALIEKLKENQISVELIYIKNQIYLVIPQINVSGV
jgi:hypothetical protein